MGRNNRTHRNRGTREEPREPGYEYRSEAEVMGRKRGLVFDRTAAHCDPRANSSISRHNAVESAGWTKERRVR